MIQTDCLLKMSPKLVKSVHS